MKSLNWWPKWLKGGWEMSKAAHCRCQVRGDKYARKMTPRWFFDGFSPVAMDVEEVVGQFGLLQKEHKKL